MQVNDLNFKSRMRSCVSLLAKSVHSYPEMHHSMVHIFYIFNTIYSDLCPLQEASGHARTQTHHESFRDNGNLSLSVNVVSNLISEL